MHVTYIENQCIFYGIYLDSLQIVPCIPQKHHPIPADVLPSDSEELFTIFFSSLFFFSLGDSQLHFSFTPIPLPKFLVIILVSSFCNNLTIKPWGDLFFSGGFTAAFFVPPLLRLKSNLCCFFCLPLQTFQRFPGVWWKRIARIWKFENFGLVSVLCCLGSGGGRGGVKNLIAEIRG